MKLLPLLALFSVSALACPKLDGTYATCVSEASKASRPFKVVVKQSVEKGVTIYELGSGAGAAGLRYVADGKERQESVADRASGLTILTKHTATCTKDKLLIQSIRTRGGKDEIRNEETMLKEKDKLILTNSSGSRIVCAP